MKRFAAATLVAGCALAAIGGCGSAAAGRRLKIVIPPEAHPRIAYGAEQLREAVVRSGGRARIVTGEPTGYQPCTIAVGTARDGRVFTDALKQVEGKQQGFTLICKPDCSALIAGVDESGALYGCLELAERMETLGGALPGDLTFSDSPRLVLRGPCIGLQRPEIIYDGVMYDYRYLPETFPWFYDRELWTRHLDLLVRHRFNTLYLWNGHPFSSILRLEKYPEAREIDDPQLEANIETFNWLCAEADRRGIWVVQFFYNIHLSHNFARHHGISLTHSQPTPLVSEYTSYCITEFIKNYPHVGLMMCLGEDLADQYDAEWLAEVIIPAVKAGLKPGQPRPPIIVRNHSTPIFEVLAKAAPLYDNIYTMAKYTSETLVSDQVGGGPGPQTSLSQWQLRHKLARQFLLIINVHCVCNLEPFRWGSPRFVRKAIASCVETGIKGLHLYPMRYWDWPYSADRAEPRLMQTDRDWIWYATWARYAWNPYRDENEENALWTRELAARYGSEQAARRILAAYELSGEVMPHISRALSTETWNIEAHTLGQTMEQFFEVSRFCAPPGESIADFAEREAAGRKHEGETPLEAARAIVENAEAALKEIQAAAPLVTKNKAEFQRLLDDLRAIRLVARFYAHKAEAAIAGLLFLHTRDFDQLEGCESLLERSVQDYRRLAELTSRTYTDCASYHGRQIPYPASEYLVWSDVLPAFERELATVKHNAKVIRRHKDTLARMPLELPPYPPVDITAVSRGQTLFRVEKGAKPYTDVGHVIQQVPEPLVGLTSIAFSAIEAIKGPCPIKFAASEPVKVFATFGPKSWLWVEPPPDWTLYAPHAFRLLDRTSGIYYRDFPSGESTIEFRKGSFALLGFTKRDAELHPTILRLLDSQFFSKRIVGGE